jgi:hypothetical protein
LLNSVLVRLPFLALATTSGPVVDAVSTIDRRVTAAAIDIPVDVHVVVTPAAAPIAPSMAPVAVIGDDRAHSDAGCEGDKRRIRIINVRRRRVIHGRRISGNVHDLRIGRRNLHNGVGDHYYALLHFRFDYHVRNHNHLLLRRAKRAGFLRFHPQCLDRVHHILVLV